MPDRSEAQKRLMEGIAHGWHPSDMKHAPDITTAKEFVAADKSAGNPRLPQRVPGFMRKNHA